MIYIHIYVYNLLYNNFLSLSLSFFLSYISLMCVCVCVCVCEGQDHWKPINFSSNYIKWVFNVHRLLCCPQIQCCVGQ